MNNKLPKIVSTVHTHTTLDGQKILFRPFKANIEQVLLEAKESKDSEIIIKSIIDVIQDSIITDINIEKLPSFEIEMLLLKLRTVSIGNEIEFGTECEHCQAINKINLDLTTVELNKTNGEMNYLLGKSESGGEDVFIKMKYPTFDNLLLLKEKKNSNILRLCIDSIHYGKNEIDLSEIKDEELDEWLNILDRTKVKVIYDFISNIPKLSTKIDFVCSECNKQNTHEIEGIESFFM